MEISQADNQARLQFLRDSGELGEIRLGYEPKPWQARFHEQLKDHRYFVQVVHRRAGKTYDAAALLVSEAMRRAGQYGYFAPELKQAKRVAWTTLKEFARNIPGAWASEGELALHLPNGSVIWLYGTSKGHEEAVRGIGLLGAVIDEIAGMPAHVWGTVIQPTLIRSNGWALFIGTPKGMDAFYDLFMAVPERSSAWGRNLMTVYDTEELTPEELELTKESISENEFAQEYLCDWHASSENILIPLTLAVEAQQRIVKTEAELEGKVRILGLDVARYGKDRSSLQPRWGKQLYDPMVYQGLSNMELCGYLLREIDEFKPHRVFIDGGRGEGVIDRARELGYGHLITEVNFGGKASDPHYVNKRTEMYDNVRQFLQEDGGVLPNTRGGNAIMRDLCAVTYEFKSDGVMSIVGKDKLRKETGQSTDLGDGVALTFAERVSGDLAQSITRHSYADAREANTWEAA